MQYVDIHTVKARLAKMLDTVGNGEQVAFTKHGKPVAPLIAARSPKMRIPGASKGRMHIANDFDAPMPLELQAAFYGK